MNVENFFIMFYLLRYYADGFAGKAKAQIMIGSMPYDNASNVGFQRKRHYF